MDLRVYTKEDVWQPEGLISVLKPDIIDIHPVTSEDEDHQVWLEDAEVLSDGNRNLTMQQCALATIWQRGLDPLEPDDGIRWAQALLGEVSAVALMQDIEYAVEDETTAVRVVFSTMTDADGNPYLTYTLKEAV